MSENAINTADLWQQLKLTPTQSTLWSDLALSYFAKALHWQAGYAARQALRLDPTLAPQLQTLPIGDMHEPANGDAQLGREVLVDAPTIEQRFVEQLEVCPGDWLTWLYVARLREMPKTPNEQVGSALQEAQRFEPLPGESLHWMGVWRLSAGDAAGAVSAFSQLLDIRPVRFGSMMYLGEALLRTGNNAAAEKAFARASLSNNPAFLRTLSARVYSQNYWQEAIEVLKKALRIQPDSVPTLLALAKIQSETYALGECRATLDRIRGLEPDNHDARLLEAGFLGRMGDAHAHLTALQSAYESNGDPVSRTASSISMTLLYQDGLSPEEVAASHRRLCAPIEAAVARNVDFTNTRSTDRWLRIGYVTGDLHRQHPVNIFMLPVLLRHDRVRFDVRVYYTGAMHDDYTRQAKANVDGWIEASALDDGALQRAILADEIDILIDLAGHTSTHRLGVFAMRAAPVQATFLGYPHSTGLSTMDWLIGDAVASPAEHAHLFSEGIAQLPDSVFCWSPVDDYPLPPARKPDAPFVFASFNNAMKVSPATVALWSRVLHAVPDSVLLLKAPSLRETAVQQRYAQMFGARGITRERLVMRGPSGLAEMMLEYGDVDIALDPLPYNGGTTTLQALWMGVPVVTLCGGNFVGRMGASFMHALGKPEWVAANNAQYVEIAIQLARDRAAVRSGRAQLRERMASSPLSDITTYVRQFETVLRRMWLAYCEGGGQRLIAAAPPKSPKPRARF